MTRRLAHALDCALLVLLVLLCRTPAALAAQPAPARAVPGDPIDLLREKLAAKLNATSQANAPYVVKVPAAAPGEFQVAARSAPATASPSADRRAAAAAGRGSKPTAPAPEGAGPAVGAWSYGGATGPEAWAALKPEFALCASGQRQSPIDLRDGFAVELEPLRFEYRPGAFEVLDNGHTVRVKVAAGNVVEARGRRYALKHLQFHRPGEHPIDGRVFEMSVHLVHEDDEGRQAVLAVAFEPGPAHPLVQAVWNNLPLEKGEPQAAPTLIDPGHLLPQARGYYTYMGSMTTPPCSEGVLWLVMQQPVPLSAEQMGLFARLHPVNARPVQAAAGRIVKHSR